GRPAPRRRGGGVTSPERSTAGLHRKSDTGITIPERSVTSAVPGWSCPGESLTEPIILEPMTLLSGLRKKSAQLYFRKKCLPKNLSHLLLYATWGGVLWVLRACTYRQF